MTKLEKMRDELAEEYCIRPLPEALKKDLLRYRPDNLKIIQRMEYAAYKHGFDASTAYHAEIIQELVKALHGLNNEVAAMVATHGDVISQDYGRTNLECLEYRLGLAKQALESVRSKI